MADPTDAEAASDGRDPRGKQVLTVFLVVLLLFAVVMVLIGEFAVAGVTFLGLTLVIYLRETW